MADAPRPAAGAPDARAPGAAVLVPGDGLVGRRGDRLLVLRGGVEHQQASRLLAVLDGELEGEAFTAAVGAAAIATGCRDVAAVALLPDGAAVLVRGAMAALVGDRVVDGRDAEGWHEHVVDDAVGAVLVAPVGGEPRPDVRTSLVDGVVPAAGVRVRLARADADAPDDVATPLTATGNSGAAGANLPPGPPAPSAAGEPVDDRGGPDRAAGSTDPTARERHDAGGGPEGPPGSTGPASDPGRENAGREADRSSGPDADEAGTAPREREPRLADVPGRVPAPHLAGERGGRPPERGRGGVGTGLEPPSGAPRAGGALPPPPPGSRTGDEAPPDAIAEDSARFVALLGDDDPDEPPAREPLPLATAADPAPADEDGDDHVLVDGVSCVRGHFNRPDVLYCSRCGISMVHATLKLSRGPRPPLGVLVADDGASWRLDGDYLVGRRPPDADLRDGLRPLVLADAEQSVSRAHAEVRLAGWDVLVVDRGSSNGTFVASPGEAWERLAQGVPRALEPGQWVLFGRRVVVFEGHHVRADQPGTSG